MVCSERADYIFQVVGRSVFPRQAVCFLSFCSLRQVKKHKNIEKARLRTQKMQRKGLQFTNNA